MDSLLETSHELHGVVWLHLMCLRSPVASPTFFLSIAEPWQTTCTFTFVFRRLFIWSTLVSVSASVACPAFLLGVDYSKRVGTFTRPLIDIDAQGAAYVLTGDSTITKFALSSDPVWEANLGLAPLAIAADSSGNIYFIPSSGRSFVGKINREGAVSSSRFDLGAGLTASALAVDFAGRVWVAGSTVVGADQPLKTTPGAFQQSLPNTTRIHIFILRLNAAANAVEYATYLAGSGNDLLVSIAVDTTGSLTIAGSTTSIDFPLTTNAAISGSRAFLTRLTPDGSGLVYSTLVAVQGAPGSLAVDSGGGAALTLTTPPYGLGLVRYAPDGTLQFARRGAGVGSSSAIDGAGNTYSTGPELHGNAPLKNSLATCGGSHLSVFSPSGDLLQGTWLPPAAGSSSTAIAVRPDSTAFILGILADSGTTVQILTRLSPTTEAPPIRLGCLTDAAVFQVPGRQPFNQGYYVNAPAGIAPGEILSLFGSGLGPAEGMIVQVSADGTLPADVSSVQVQFDGVPAALLYVQDAQINAIVPWSLAGRKSSEVCVLYARQRTNCLTVSIVDAAPAAFTSDGYYAAAVNQDGTINSPSHPAPPGSIVSLFATGLGPIAPAASDGAFASFPPPVNQLPVTADDVVTAGILGTKVIPYDVTYFGPAPFQPVGLSQINVRVPPSASSFSAPNVYIHVGGVTARCVIFTGL